MRNMLRGFRLLAAALFLLGTTLPALAINYNDNCAGQIPTNQGSKWFGSCPDPIYNETNWEGDILPNSSDQAIIDVMYGEILVNGHAEAGSVEAPGGLLLDAPSYSLELFLGTSVINDLRLLGNADITTHPGVVLRLPGNTRLRSDVYGPGILESTDNLSLNWGRLWDGAILTNQDSATLTTGYFLLGSGNSIFINNGSFEISGSSSEIAGAQSLLQNNGSLVFNWTGSNSFYIHSNYVQEGGSLHVQNGTLRLNSVTTDFRSGSVTVEAGAILEKASNLGGDQDHRYSGSVTMNGGGWVYNYHEVKVEAPLTLDLGSGNASGGSGGYWLGGELILEADVTNTGRFRFNNGAISSYNYRFVNAANGSAFTTSSGGGLILAEVLNLGTFQLAGGIGIENRLENFGTFRIRGGNLSGAGLIVLKSGSELSVELANPDATSLVSVEIDPRPNSQVHAYAGHLQINSELGSGGVLEEGNWIADQGTTIGFHEEITRLGAWATLTGDISRFVNVNLEAITEEARVTTENWSTYGDLFLDGGDLNIEAGGDGVTVNGTMTTGDGSRVSIAPGCAY